MAEIESIPQPPLGSPEPVSPIKSKPDHQEIPSGTSVSTTSLPEAHTEQVPDLSGSSGIPNGNDHFHKSPPPISADPVQLPIPEPAQLQQPVQETKPEPPPAPPVVEEVKMSEPEAIKEPEKPSVDQGEPKIAEPVAEKEEEKPEEPVKQTEFKEPEKMEVDEPKESPVTEEPAKAEADVATPKEPQPELTPKKKSPASQKSPRKSPANQKAEKVSPVTGKQEQSVKAQMNAGEQESPTKQGRTSRKRKAEGQDETGEQQPSQKAAKTPAVSVSPPLETPGKRIRRQTAHFSAETPSVEKTALTIPKGSGSELGNIPFVDHKIKYTKVEGLKVLHRLCYKRQGTAQECRKDLRQFCGFEFEKDSKEFEAFKKFIERQKTYTITNMRQVCDLLGLQKGGTRPEIIHRVVEFLTKPADTGLAVAKSSSKKSKSKKGGSKKKGAAKKPAAKGSPSKRASKGGAKDTSESSGGESDSSSDDEGSPSEEESGSEPEQKPSTSPSKRGTRAAAPAPASARKAKAPSGKSKFPTDGEIKSTIQALLKNADLSALTLKTVVQQVNAKYQEQDLSAKKQFIKDTVRDLLNVK